MAEQSSSNNKPAPRPGQNNQRRHHGRRRQPNPNNPNNPNQPRAVHPNQKNHPQNNPQSNQQRPAAGPANKLSLIDRIYEKYQNLLEQHLIARKKYHDLFYRADPPQKNKLERQFFGTLRDINDFEARLNPAERELFEKRNNGLALDLTYSTLNAAALEASTQEVPSGPSDPHYMQSQKNASYKEDKEESVGSKDDYEKYKIAH
jgi:hypothetical protein